MREYVYFKGNPIEVKDGILEIYDMWINDISELVGLEKLSNLYTIYIRNNLIKEIRGLDRLTGLERISLKNNNISEINGLDTLTQLKGLYLEYNQITEIKGLGHLQNLEKIDLHNNQIAEIKGLENLTNLQELNLNGNQIAEIKGLENLKSLRSLYLKGNQIPKNLIEELGGFYPDGNARRPQKFVEYCRVKRGKEEEGKSKILIFISYATKDSDLFQIPKIAETLRTKPEIDEVLYWERNMKDDIYKYMNTNLGKCDILILFCSKNALKSENVEMEWMAGLKTKKKIIPVFQDEKVIPPLLTTKLGIEFNSHNLSETIEKIYSLILKKLS